MINALRWLRNKRTLSKIIPRNYRTKTDTHPWGKKFWQNHSWKSSKENPVFDRVAPAMRFAAATKNTHTNTQTHAIDKKREQKDRRLHLIEYKEALKTLRFPTTKTKQKKP